MTTVPSLQVDDLSISPELDPESGELRCVWQGKSNHRYPARILGPWFEQILDLCEARGDTPIKMCFDQLQHFNSSTIGAIVQFIQHTRARQVPLTLVYNGDERWQRVSFEALKVFDKGDGSFSLQVAQPA